MECNQLCVTGITFTTPNALPSLVRDAGPSSGGFSGTASGTAEGGAFRDVLQRAQGSDSPVAQGQPGAVRPGSDRGKVDKGNAGNLSASPATPDKVPANKPGPARPPVVLGTRSNGTLPSSSDQAVADADATPDSDPGTAFGEDAGAEPVPQGRTSLPGSLTSGLPIWDPTLGTGQVVVAQNSATKPAVKEKPLTLLSVLLASPGKASTSNGTVPVEPGKGKAANGIDDAAETPAIHAGEGKPPAVVVAPVDVAPPPVIPVAFALSSPRGEVATAFGKSGPNAGRSVSTVAATQTQELQLAPDAAVRLIIKSPGEAAPPAEATAQAAGEPAISATIASELPPSRDTKPESVKSAPPTEPSKPREVDSPVRVEPPVRTSPAHALVESDADRRVAGKKQPSTEAEAPLDTPVIRRSQEMALAPAVSPKIPDRPAAPALPQTQAAATPKEQVLADPLPKAPLKTMSLEFSPDGSGDVHLKLAERAGEVHVSLHSNDPAMNHQLRNGISDLASALAGAGYEADAWTSPDGGGRQQREQSRQSQQQPANAGKAFDLEMNQSPQEVL